MYLIIWLYVKLIKCILYYFALKCMLCNKSSPTYQHKTAQICHLTVSVGQSLVHHERIHCPESHQTEIKVLVGAMVLIWGPGSSSKLTVFGENSFPCGCRTEVPIFHLAVDHGHSLLLDVSCSFLPCSFHSPFQCGWLLSSRAAKMCLWLSLMQPSRENSLLLKTHMDNLPIIKSADLGP